MTELPIRSPAWIRTTNLNDFEVSQVIDSTKSLKSSRVSKQGIGTKSVQFMRLPNQNSYSTRQILVSTSGDKGQAAGAQYCSLG
jgi:hypothetical protein